MFFSLKGQASDSVNINALNKCQQKIGYLRAEEPFESLQTFFPCKVGEEESIGL
jgi:hypothetical protein